MARFVALSLLLTVPIGLAAQATPAPDVGEHSDAILREHGLALDEIARLREQGVIG